MPTQQANLTSETECDAAALGLDLSMALVKDATMDEAFAAASPHAPVAALDASPDKDEAGPPRTVLSLLGRWWHAFQERRQCQSLHAALLHLTDRDLRDIGLRRDEIDYIAPHRAIDTLRDGTRDFWFRSRGVM